MRDKKYFGVKLKIFTLAIFIFCSSAIYAQKIDSCAVTAFVGDSAGSVTIRADAGTEYGIVGNIPRDESGTLVFIDGSRGDWLKIRSATNSDGQVFDGTGWIYAPLLSVKLPNDVENLKVYKSPGESSERINYTSFGISVEIHGCQDNWYKVRLPVTGTGILDYKLFGWLPPDAYCGSPWANCDLSLQNDYEQRGEDTLNNKIIPIIDTEIGSILGGTNTSGFYLVSAKETYEHLKNRTDKISFNSFVPVADYQTERRIKKLSNARANCENFYAVSLDKPIKGILIGTNMDWQPDYPAPTILWQRQAGKYWPNQTYEKAVAGFLKTKGIANPKIQIIEAKKINLDADDETEEIIINAAYFKDKSSVFKMSPGDYHVVFIRRIVNGKVRNIVVDGDFADGKNFGAIIEHEIAGVLDLNGDGNKEIILHTKVPEGRWATVHAKEGNGFVEVLRTGCSA